MDRVLRPDWERLDPRAWAGEAPGEWQRIDDVVSRPVDDHGGGDAFPQPNMGPNLAPAAVQAVWGRITGEYIMEGTGSALYTFSLVYHAQNVAFVLEDGFRGVALEVNYNTHVPTDGTVVVPLWPSEDTLEGDGAAKWRFFFPSTSARGDTTVLTSQDVTWTTDQNDFDVDDGVSIVRMESTSSISLTGAQVEDGRTIVWRNVGTTNTITIPHDSPSSSTSARFYIPGGGTIVLGPGDQITTFQDSATGRNVVISTTAPILRTYQPTLTGTSNDLAVLAGITALQPTLTGATSITGIAGLTAGTYFTILNPAANSDSLTLVNNSGSSSVGNRFDLSLGVDLVFAPGQGGTFYYDGAGITDVGIAAAVASSVAGGGSPTDATWTPTAVKTGTYTAAIGELVLVDTSGGAFTVNLPTAVGNSGKKIAVKQVSGSTLNAVTLDGDGSETIDEQATYTLGTSPAYNCIEIISDGSNWWVLHLKGT